MSQDLTETIYLRVSPAQKRLWAAAAAQDQRRLSDYIRVNMDFTASQDLAQKDQSGARKE